jgi:predicted amidohydrolase
VAAVQFGSGLDPQANRSAIAAHVREVAEASQGQHPDLVVFPESSLRDFGDPGSDLSEFAEALDGPLVASLTDAARTHSVTVVAGMFEVGEDPARPFNTVVVVDGGGLRASYRKIHLYDSFGYQESSVMAAGPIEPVLFELGDLTFGVMTCYDLRFPELARLLVDRGAQALVVPSAWVAGPRKVDHWRTLVAARAIENTTYVVAAGQPAPRYTGHSLIVDPRGDVLAEAGSEAGAVVSADLTRDLVVEVRRENPSLANRRL